MVKRQVLGQELEKKAAVSDSEARAYYDAHKPEFERKDTVVLQEIVVGDAGRARDLVRRARAGED